MAVHFVFVCLGMVLMCAHALEVGPVKDSCLQKTGCVCEYDNGVSLDLRPLSNDNSSEPRFKDMQSEILGSAKYSWNPCQPFSEGDACQNVIMCEKISGQNITYIPIATLDQAVFSNDETTGNLHLEYGVESANRTTIIVLMCDQYQDGQFVVKGEEPSGSGRYFFELHSKYVCKTTNSSTINGYSVYILILTVLFSAFRWP